MGDGGGLVGLGVGLGMGWGAVWGVCGLCGLWGVWVVGCGGVDMAVGASPRDLVVRGYLRAWLFQQQCSRR